jgi:tetratricopeptide (TPR) repeat protein
VPKTQISAQGSPLIALKVRLRAKIVSACTSSIDANHYQGTQLGLLFLGRANAYDFMGDKARALADYNKAIEMAPTFAGIYYNRGVCRASCQAGQNA